MTMHFKPQFVKSRTCRIVIIIKLFSVPPIDAQLSGGVEIYIAGQVYNISCKVTGSNPPPKIKVSIGLRQLEALDYQVRPFSKGREGVIQIPVP